MDIGVDSFAAIVADEGNQAQSPQARLADLLDEIEIADQVGLDLFGIGEHHRADFLDSAPTMILAAAAARTASIRLTSAVTVLSAADPVRVFQEFATLDLISKGRAEMIVGRGSFTEAHSLFGFRLEDYDDLFAEKLDLLLRIRDEPELHWSGRFRPALSGQAILPRPLQASLPIWLGVGGTPQSFVRAGVLGLPLMVAIIGGEFRRFRPLVDLYREAGRRAGHPAERLKVGVGPIHDQDWQGTGLAAGDPTAVRRGLQRRGRLPGGRARNCRRKDAAREPSPGRPCKGACPDDIRRGAACGNEALD
jgi:alkanesulfonate monooxygenase SsuD/methylene tetrahydromethanopterin reductase-like flavin-dependent oxidoreductase (luciferase family)